jgi:sugar phosphate permease
MDENIQNIFNKTILIVNVSLFGFSQFVVWPLNLSMLSDYYKPKTDGGMIALWSSGWELGSILSFLVSNFMVFSLRVRW